MSEEKSESVSLSQNEQTPLNKSTRSGNQKSNMGTKSNNNKPKYKNKQENDNEEEEAGVEANVAEDGNTTPEKSKQKMRTAIVIGVWALTVIGCLLTFLGFSSNFWLEATVNGTNVHNGLFEKCQTALNGKDTCNSFQWGEELTGRAPDKIRAVQALATISGILVLFTAVVAVICLFNLKCRCADDKCRRVLHMICYVFLFITGISSVLSSTIFLGLYREFQLYDDAKVDWSVIVFTCGSFVIFLAQLTQLIYTFIHNRHQSDLLEGSCSCLQV